MKLAGGGFEECYNVFRIIKPLMCFRQLSLRSLKHVQQEGTPACCAWYLKHAAVLRPQ